MNKEPFIYLRENNRYQVKIPSHYCGKKIKQLSTTLSFGSYKTVDEAVKIRNAVFDVFLASDLELGLVPKQ